jgi:hypothetical protein
MQNDVENAYMIGNLKLLAIAVWLVVVWRFLPERLGENLVMLAGLATVLSVLSLPQVGPRVTPARIFAGLGLLTILFLIAAFLLAC